MGKRSVKGEVDPKVAQRWAQALEMRKAGFGYAKIATQLGFSGPGAAHNAIRRALRAIMKEPGDEVLKLELERLDRIQLALWKQAIGGSEKSALAVLKVMERRSRLLGLDAPVAMTVELAKAYSIENDPEDL